MADQKSVSFIKFSAINEFMLDDYRIRVLQRIFDQFANLAPDWQRKLVLGIKSRLVIPGFRNPNQAPQGLKMRHAVQAFQKDAAFCGLVLQIWSETHPGLRAKVAEILAAKGWELLPVEVDRSILPGFLTEWPEGEDYDTVEKAFHEAGGSSDESEDDIRLMAVWVSGRLPVRQSPEQVEE